MKVLENIITALDDFAWGPWMLILLVGTGIFVTARNGFIQFGHLGYALKNTIGKMYSQACDFMCGRAFVRQGNEDYHCIDLEGNIVF